MKRVRFIPAIHELKRDERFLILIKDGDITNELLTAWIQEEVDYLRVCLLKDKWNKDTISRASLTELIFERVAERLEGLKNNNLRRVINATGVVLHTNLGRARLSEQAKEHVSTVASAYSTLEFNIHTGERGSRHAIVEDYLVQLTGAEAALVVNNNAAAVYFILKTLAKGQEVIVSRGELVEIGGTFRISEIMAESEAKLVEVGTTNKTYINDYERAITEETALLMKVHKSNFALVGFTYEVDAEDLRQLARSHQIPIYEDLGSGTLIDFREGGIGREPTVQERVASGIDILSFSGDKLLGGPQAGIVVGKKQHIDQLKNHQLARVLRVDKFTLAALEATLKSYIAGNAEEEVPTVRDISLKSNVLLNRVTTFKDKLDKANISFHSSIEKDLSKVGGGTMPEVELATYVVRVRHESLSGEKVAEKLREAEIPIIVRVKSEAVLLDFRVVDDADISLVVEAFIALEKN